MSTAAMAAATKKKNRWAEEEDEEDVLPVKTAAKSKVKEVRIRVPLRVKARSNLPRFGDAKVGEENVTLRSPDLISMEHPDDQLMEDAEDPTMAKTLANFINKQAETRLARERDIDMDNTESAPDVESSSAAPKVEKYVAPGARAAALAAASGVGSAASEEMETTLRVSNLTKAVTEDDLRDLFGRFGRISRIFLPKDERNIPKGYAYIAYDMRRDAEMAKERLQGYGYDHLIINIEWAKPVRDGGGGGGMDRSYMSGYGKALAQDTNEKVSYFSTGK